MLTDSQWKAYEDKYGKLMYQISYMITGDTAIATPKDNYADLCIAALNSVRGFKNKTGLEFDEFFDTKLFDQYTKTVLWNHKNKKGADLTNKFPFRNKHWSIDSGTWNDDYSSEETESFNLEDKRLDTSNVMELNEMFNSVDDNVKKVIKAILENPSVLTEDGAIVVKKLAKKISMSSHFANKAVKDLARILKLKYMEGEKWNQN